MKVVADSRLIGKLGPAQGGVFSTADLKTAFAEPHTAGFTRRIQALLKQEVLFRFCRGYYVTEEFELPILSQRLAPHSCISFETVLASKLVIGTDPDRRIVATKVGAPRIYTARGYEIEHVSLAAPLSFGWLAIDGVRYANAEKAVLDVLYFHLRGRRYAFDIYSDINHKKLDLGRIKEYLQHYRNPKFVTFAKRTLKLA